jgi:hypothetical protein
MFPYYFTYTKLIISQADLGTQSADAIKTSDYGRNQQRTFRVARTCDIRGTPEAAAVKNNASGMLAWSSRSRRTHFKVALTDHPFRPHAYSSRTRASRR